MSRSLSEIAADIRKNWRDANGMPNVNYAAKPYLDAMAQLNTINDTYIAESARSIVAYFLSNAAQWRGPEAKRLKAELKKMAGIK